MHNKNSNNLFESLEYKDMEGLMKPTIHVDEFSSKMGDDDDIIVISFFVRDAQAAKDLRLKVYSMVNEGSTDQEVKDYLVQRYGNIVLYQPPFNYSTAALWIFPLLLLIFFILFSIKMIKLQDYPL